MFKYLYKCAALQDSPEETPKVRGRPKNELPFVVVPVVAPLAAVAAVPILRTMLRIQPSGRDARMPVPRIRSILTHPWNGLTTHSAWYSFHFSSGVRKLRHSTQVAGMSSLLPQVKKTDRTCMGPHVNPSRAAAHVYVRMYIYIYIYIRTYARAASQVPCNCHLACPCISSTP